MTYLYAADVVGVLEDSVVLTIDIVKTFQTSDFVLVVCHVPVDMIAEVFTDLVVPCQRELYTCVLDITTVDIRSFKHTHGSLHRSLYQPVLGLLLIPVEVHAKTAVEELSVETEVELL